MKAQTTLYSESFEVDGEGATYTSNHFNSGLCDFWERSTVSPLNSCFGSVNSGFSAFRGSFFWGSEDVEISPGPNPAGNWTSSSINITNYGSLTVSLFLACSNNNTTRWESADSINIQASIDNGPFRTVGRFMGDAIPGGNLKIDANLNGVIDVGETIIASIGNFTQYTFNISGSGAAMKIRVDADQIGGSEELGWDDLVVVGVSNPCTPPSCTCPPTQTLNLDNLCQALVPDYRSLGTAVGGSCGPMTIVQSTPAIGSTVSSVGSFSVTLFAQNTASQGSTNTCSFTVNKVDAILPAITCPANQSVNTGAGVCTATVSYTAPVGTDNCTGATTARIAGLASGVAFPKGINTVTYRVTDGSGNSASCSFTITVNDAQVPTITCPSAQTLTLNTSCQATLPDYTSLATGVSDNCSPAPTVTQSPAIGSTQTNPGALTVTLTATDGSANTSTCSFTVNKISPEIDVQGNSVSIVDGDLTPSLTDHTDFGSVAVSGNVVRTFTISNSGNANLTIAAGAITLTGTNANQYAIGGITLPATIASGNSTTFTVTFTPTTGGLKTATVNIANNDCNENPYDYAIQGSGLSTAGAALNFDAFDDIVMMGASATLDNMGPSGCTFEAWVNPGHPTNTLSIVRKSGDYNFYLNAGNVYAEIWPLGIGNPLYMRFSGSSTIPTNTWTHVAFVWDGTTGLFYVNGVAESATLFTTNISATENLSLGRSTIFNNPYEGSMDEVRIWRRALCQNEIQNNRTCEIPTTAPNLVANYHFNQGLDNANNAAVTTLNDASGNGNNGTLTNFALIGTTSNWLAPGGVTSGSSCTVFTQPEMNVQGNSVTILDGDNTPSVSDFTDFGSVLVCTGSISKTFTIQNTGTANLSVSIGTNFGDFTTTAAPVSPVVPGGSTTFTITFDPTTAGLRTANISITSNDCNENPYNFAIQGTGLADVTPPTITCPTTQTLALNASCQATLPSYTSLASGVTDNCPTTPTVTQVPVTGTALSGVGTTTVTLTATDGAANTATCSFSVSRLDAIAPTISCPANVSVNASVGVCTATVTYTSPVGSDNCSGPITIQTTGIASGGSFPGGVTTNTFRVTDGSGNTSTCSFTVTVTDNQLPAITCPANQSVNAGVGVCNATVTYTAPVGTDNCAGPTTTQTAGFASGASFTVGVTTNTFRVTDGSGNTATCSFTVTVVDNQNPAITCPANVSVNTTLGLCSATATYTAPVGTDNCSGQTTTQTVGLASGGTYPIGVTTNTFSVTDASGNTATCSFTVTVVDNQNPAITCPANISVNASPGLCTATATYTAPVGTDNCVGQTTTQTAGLASGATFLGGVTTNVFRVTDAAGNTATCSFTVTVVDNQAPTISCPANINVNANPGVCTGTATYTTPVGADNCASPSTVQIAGLASGATYPGGLTTNTFRVTDGSGNTATCSFTVTVNDNQLPTITCPANSSVNAGAGLCAATFTYTAPVGSDNCTGQTTTQIGGLASGASFPVGTTTNAFRVTDAAGNTATCSFTVTVIDNQVPVITCPANISGNNDPGLCSKVVSFTAPVGSDNCSGPVTVQTAGIASSGTFPVGVTTNTFRVTDAAGNTATCSFTVTISDNQLPSITCPANVSVNAGVGVCTATATYTAPVGTDNCAGQTTSQTAGLASGATYPSGLTTNTFRVTDASGNSATCSFTVTVVDNQLPTITCPANMSVNASVGVCTATVTYTAPVGTDNCAGQTTTQTAGLASGATFPGGLTTNTFRVTDASGNSATCSFTVTVVDNQLPTITCPANINANAGAGLCTAVATYTAPVGVDNCAGPTTAQTAGLASGAAFPVGTTTNTFRVTDGAGNTATCSFTVTVVDNQAPTITCPANASVNATLGQCSANFSYTAPVGADNCPGQSTLQTAGLASGAAYPTGITTNTFRVTDASGNTATCSFTVTVSDNQLPTITCPANATVSASLGLCTAPFSYTAPTGIDNCAGQTTLQTSGLVSGANYPVGITTNGFRVTDASGNTATCAFTVTVTDNELPTITCPANASVPASVGTCAATFTYVAPSGADNCAGQTTVRTTGLASGASYPVGVTTNTFTVTDASSNTAICAFTVTVTDNQLPTITCPANINGTNDGGLCSKVVTYSAPVGTDNCPGQTTTLIGGLSSGAAFPVGTTTNTYRVTDAVGNSASCSFTVVITDTQLPTITCPANITTGMSPGQCNAVVTFSTPVGSDNCAGAVTVLTSGIASGGTFPSGFTTNSFRVTDASGNTATCSFNVQVNDNLAPSISCPANISTNAAVGACNAIVTYTAPVGTDNCPGSGTSLIGGFGSGGSFPVGVTTNTFRVTDASGNTTTCSFTVTVVDNQPPTITCPANISIGTSVGLCNGVATYAAPVGSDNCSGATTTQTAGLASGATYPLGTTTNTFRVTAGNGAFTTCSFTVTVSDAEAPAAICQNITLNLNGAGSVTINASQVNNGSSDNCGIATTAINATSFGCINVGPNNVTLTVTDVNGNTSSCLSTVTVRDISAPSAICQNITVNLNSSGAATITGAQLNNGSSDACGVASLVPSTSTFGCANVGANTVTLTVTDANANTATCNSTVTVRDLVAPTAICQNITVNLSSGGSATITPSQINNGSNDACGISSLGATPLNYNCANVGNNTAILVVTDVNANTATCTATVVVRDVTAPTAVCQDITVNLSASGTVTITPAQINNGSSDVCGIGTLSLNTSSFNCANTTIPISVTLTVSDVNANTSTCLSNVTVRDVTPPTALCHGVTVNLNSGGTANLTPFQVNNGSNDPCGLQPASLSQTSFNCSNVGNNNVVLTVTDWNGNSSTCSAVIVVRDLVAPTAVCQNITTYLGAAGTAIITPSAIDNGSSDACGITTRVLSQSTYNCSNVGTNTVTLTLTDANGNTASCSSVNFVMDSVRPSGSCNNLTVYLDAQGSAVISVGQVNNNFTDACGIASMLLSNSSFNCSNVGSNTVTLTVTDNNNNTASCSSTLSVNDSIPPIIVLPPPPAAVLSDSALCGARVTWSPATATDNCTVISLTSNHSPNDVFPIGSTTVTYTATDNHGNSSSASFVVTVNPVPLQVVIRSAAFGCGYNVACAADSNASAGAYATGGCLPYNFAWSNGALLDSLNGLAPGFYSVTVTDGNQETAVDTFTITAPAPLMLTLTGDTLVCDGLSDGNIGTMVTGGHDCAAFTYDWSNGATIDSLSGLASGSYTVTVTDILGCSVSASRILQAGANPVLDLGADTTKCPGASVLFEAPSIYSAYLWNDGSDNSTILMTIPGQYTCTVWTAGGCTDTDTVLLMDYVVDQNIITATGPSNLCDGDTMVLEGDAGLLSYSWSTGEVTASIIVAGFGGPVSLSAIDAHGCPTSDTVVVNYTPFTDPQPVITPGPNAVVCIGSTLQLDVQTGYFAYSWSTGATTPTITVSSAGAFQVTVSNGFGCTRTSDPTFVTVGALPTPTVIVGVNDLSTGNYASYQWLLNGNVILGAITQVYQPVQAGNFSVVVTDSNGCSGTSDPVFFNPVGVEEQVLELNGLTLYPNPTNGMVNLRTLNPIDWPLEVEVWDMFGQRVKFFTMAHLMDVTAFDLTDLAAAPYTMKVTTLQRNHVLQTTFRVVVE